MLPFSPPPWWAPPAVGAAAALVPALGTRTFLNIPSRGGITLLIFPSSSHAIPAQLTGTRVRAVGFWLPRSGWLVYGNGERILKLSWSSLGSFTLSKVVRSGKWTYLEKFRLNSTVARSGAAWAARYSLGRRVSGCLVEELGCQITQSLGKIVFFLPSST